MLKQPPRLRVRILRILTHIVVWVGFFSLPVLLAPIARASDRIQEFHTFWKEIIISHIVIIALYYANAYIFIPALLARRHFAAYGAVLLLIIALVVAWGLWVVQDLEMRSHLAASGPPAQVRILVGVLVAVMVLFASTAITVAQGWLRSEQGQTEARAERNAAELAFLKSQVHPHFLFNTLNNIYSLSVVKPEAAPEAIMKLSGLMRYLLHSSNAASVALDQELAYINDFIALQQLRLPTHVAVHNHTEGATAQHPIAPMLLIPLVENAFKHGVSPTVPCEIAISTRVSARQLVFQVKNQIFPATQYADSGVGLTNVRRRLELLYPGQHALEVSNQAGFFVATLTLASLPQAPLLP